MKKCSMIMLFLVALTSAALGQKKDVETSKEKRNKFYIYWGWNKENYSRSNISFQGIDYDFTLQNVEAVNRQSPFSFDTYLNPSNATIPQYNFRIGYFLNNKYNISIGVDHMKYVVQQNQAVKISGRIDGNDTEYQGIYMDENIILKENFLKFEHTDGLNFVNTDIRRVDNIISFGIFKISLTEGFGIGVLIPRTDATILGRERHDKFHLSGYGLSGVIGLNFNFFKHFFIQTEYKGGFINMQDIKTGFTKFDKGQQHFFFGQYNVLFGYAF